MNEGIIEPVNDNDTTDATHYLPHRPVVREERDTTQVRTVYDASAKTSGQFSLNVTLHNGPCFFTNYSGNFIPFSPWKSNWYTSSTFTNRNWWLAPWTNYDLCSMKTWETLIL